MPGGGGSGGAGGLPDGRRLGEGGEEDIVKDMLGAHGRGTSDVVKTHGGGGGGGFVRRKYLRRKSPRSGGASNGGGASEVDSTRVRTDAAHALA